jgi:hypothetical protein
MSTYDDGIELNPELAIRLGFVAVQWARIEDILQRICIGVLRAKGQHGYILASELGNRTMENFLRTAASVYPPTPDNFATDLEVICNEFSRLLGIRNYLLHNIWPRNKNPKRMIALVKRFKGKVRLHEEIWTDTKIDRIAEQCIDLLEVLEDFALKHDLLRPMNDWKKDATSHGKPPKPSVPEIQARNPKFAELLRHVRSSRA